MPRRHSPRLAGITLLELMIVVAIVGILATVAGPALHGYIQKSRASEGPAMLGMIKLRQEAYRSEFGTYVQALPKPSALNGTSPVEWPANVPGDGWMEMGFAPSGGRTRFTLAVQAGPPSTAPTGQGYSGNDFWFMSMAVADFDRDGNTVTFTGFSEADHIACDRIRGWD